MHSEERVPEGDNKFSALARLWIRSAVHRLWTSSTRPYPYRTNGRCKYFSLSLSQLFSFSVPFISQLTAVADSIDSIHPPSLLSQSFILSCQTKGMMVGVLFSLSLSLFLNLCLCLCVCVKLVYSSYSYCYWFLFYSILMTFVSGLELCVPPSPSTL